MALYICSVGWFENWNFRKDLPTLWGSSKRVSTTYYICTATAACSRRNCPIGKYWSVKRGIGENLVTQLIVSKRVFASISARQPQICYVPFLSLSDDSTSRET